MCWSRQLLGQSPYGNSLEVLVVRDDVVPNFDDSAAPLLKRLLQQQWLQCCIQCLRIAGGQHTNTEPMKIVFFTQA
jgi:hypothetical protein